MSMLGLINKHAALVIHPCDAIPRDWIAAAGLDWEPEIRPLSYTRGDGRLIETDISRVVVRSDTGAALAVVGGSYHATPHRRVLSQAADVLDAQGFRLRCAGSIHGGMIPFAEFAAADPTGHDPIRPSVLLMPRHDLARPMTIGLETRIGCTNVIEAIVLGWGFGTGKSTQRMVTHRWKSETQEATLVRAAETAIRGAENMSVRADRMRKVPMTTQDQVEFLAHAFGLKDADEKKRERAQLFGAARDAVPGYNEQLGQNVWSALQCVSHAIDHRNRSSGRMLMSAITGRLASLRSRANRMADGIAENGGRLTFPVQDAEQN